MIFDNSLKLTLVINEDIRPIQPPKKPKRQATLPKNKYEAEVEATYRINEDMRTLCHEAASTKKR